MIKKLSILASALVLLLNFVILANDARKIAAPSIEAYREKQSDKNLQEIKKKTENNVENAIEFNQPKEKIKAQTQDSQGQNPRAAQDIEKSSSQNAPLLEASRFAADRALLAFIKKYSNKNNDMHTLLDGFENIQEFLNNIKSKEILDSNLFKIKSLLTTSEVVKDKLKDLLEARYNFYKHKNVYYENSLEEVVARFKEAASVRVKGSSKSKPTNTLKEFELAYSYKETLIKTNAAIIIFANNNANSMNNKDIEKLNQMRKAYENLKSLETNGELTTDNLNLCIKEFKKAAGIIINDDNKFNSSILMPTRTLTEFCKEEIKVS